VLRDAQRGHQQGTASKEQQGNGFYGLAIGFTVAAAACAVGGVSGGVFNPQVALGGATGGVFAWSTIWIYLVVQLGAGIIAGLAFLVLDPGDGALRTYTGGSNRISRPAGPNPVPAQRGESPSTAPASAATRIPSSNETGVRPARNRNPARSRQRTPHPGPGQQALAHGRRGRPDPAAGQLPDRAVARSAAPAGTESAPSRTRLGRLPVAV
jgi:hypothetical protein